MTGDPGKDTQEQLRIQAVQLAVSLLTQNNHRLTSNHCGLLRGWLLAEIDLHGVSNKSRRVFEKAFQKMIKASHNPMDEDLVTLGQAMKNTSTEGEQQEILEFCIHLINLCEIQCDLAWTCLQRIAVLWHSHTENLCVLLEKKLPAHKLGQLDPHIVLGIQPDMPQEQIVHQLTRSYARWHARVTHSDKAVRVQAESLLQWIAQTRSQLCAS